MLKGGYQIIDLKDVDFNNDGGQATIKGIYNLIESTRKPLLLSGLTINGIEQPDFFVNVVLNGLVYRLYTIHYDVTLAIASLSMVFYTIEITQDDLVTVNEI